MQQSTNTIFKLLAKKSQQFNAYQQGQAPYCQDPIQQQSSTIYNNDLQKPFKQQQQQQPCLSTPFSIQSKLLDKQQKFNHIEEEHKTNCSTSADEESHRIEDSKHLDHLNGNNNNFNSQQSSNNKRANAKSSSEENKYSQNIESVNIKRKISLILNEHGESSYLESKILNNHITRQRKQSDFTDDFFSFEPQVTKKQQQTHFKPFISSQIRHKYSMDTTQQCEPIIIENEGCQQQDAQQQAKDNIDCPHEQEGPKLHQYTFNAQKVGNQKSYPQSCPVSAMDDPQYDKCYFTPLNKCQKLRSKDRYHPKTAGQMLDEDNFSLSNHSNNNLSTSEDETSPHYKNDLELKRIVDNIVLVNQASYFQCNKINKLTSKVYLNCYFKHKFVLTVQELQDSIWCSRCDIMLNKIKTYARQFQGMCLNKVYQPNLIYQCQNNHLWETSHKSWNKKWCVQCDKQQKEDMKRQFKEREEKIYYEKLKLQEELFNQARQNMQYAQNVMFQQKQQKEKEQISFSKRVINAFQKVEMDILKVAKEKSQEYIKERSNLQQETNVQIEQIIAVFKMILLPDGILKQYFQVLSQDLLKQEYRKMALSVHPDKNKHPKASLAFQKLSNIYSEIVERHTNIKN